MSFYTIKIDGENYLVRSPNLEIDKIPCRGSGFYCLLSRSDGAIQSFSYKPVYVPINKKPRENRLNEEELISVRESVQKWISTEDYFKGHVSTITDKEIRLVIAPDFNIFSVEQIREFSKGANYYYAWEIEIDIEERAGKTSGFV